LRLSVVFWCRIWGDMKIATRVSATLVMARSGFGLGEPSHTFLKATLLVRSLIGAQRERCHLSMVCMTRVDGVIILDRRRGVSGRFSATPYARDWAFGMDSALDWSLKRPVRSVIAVRFRAAF
jgi:hypothetical protein